MTISAKIYFMNGQKTKYLVWLTGFTILLSCFVGGGFWLSSNSIGGAPASLATDVERDNAVVRPEIDLKVPGATEIALFALG